jgi:hypothetical protein
LMNVLLLQIFPPILGKSNCHMHCQKCIFMACKNMGQLASWTEFCRTLGQSTTQIPTYMPSECGTGTTSPFYYNFYENNTELSIKPCTVLRWDFNYGKVASVIKHYFMKSYETVVVQHHASSLH